MKYEGVGQIDSTPEKITFKKHSLIRVKELITGLTGFPSLCAFGYMWKRGVLGDPTLIPLVTLLLIKMSIVFSFV